MNFLKDHFEKIAFSILLISIGISIFNRFQPPTHSSAETSFLHTPPLPDKDKDGMPDFWERRYKLNPNLNDANNDPDKDGFTNLEEYRGGQYAGHNDASPNDPNEHPPLATKLKLIKIKKVALPFRFMALSVNHPTDKKSWDLQVKSPKDSFKRIGDELPLGIKIIDIELNKNNEDKSLIVLSSKEQGVFKVPFKGRIYLPKPLIISFKYTLNKKEKAITIRGLIGKKLKLSNKKGRKDTYFISKVSEKRITLRQKQSKKNFSFSLYSSLESLLQ